MHSCAAKAKGFYLQLFSQNHLTFFIWMKVCSYFISTVDDHTQVNPTLQILCEKNCIVVE